jgi:hypothetical protein
MHPRLMTHAPRDGRRVDRDVDQLLRRRPLRHCRIGHEDSVALPHENVDSERSHARLRIDHVRISRMASA